MDLTKELGSDDAAQPCRGERPEESAARKRVPSIAFSLGHDPNLVPRPISIFLIASGLSPRGAQFNDSPGSQDLRV